MSRSAEVAGIGDHSGTIACIVGARPNFMKMAPLIRAFDAEPRLPGTTLIHTGQHYDFAMSDALFRDLGLPVPDINLDVGPASHAVQTAEVMTRIEPVLDELRPACVVVVGDVNSTLAVALVAAKKGVPVVHVEAGLRSHDRTMPEEVNRVLTDQISDLLFTTERQAEDNLAREGIPRDRVHFVGNVMIDTLLAHRDRAAASFDPARFGVLPGAFGLMTLHRPSNVDDVASFDRLMLGLEHVAADVPLLFPVHPRTRVSLATSPIASRLLAAGRRHVVDPLGYLEFLGAMSAARVVVTDSGGVQEETTVLGVPCLTLRENTERPATITQGTNTLVGTSPERIAAAWDTVRASPPPHRIPELWDGRAAERIAGVLRGLA